MSYQDQIKRIKELVPELMRAKDAYEKGIDLTMQDWEYDLAYKELEELEACTGVVLSGSVTQNLCGETLSSIPKVWQTKQTVPETIMKTVEEVYRFVKGKAAVMSYQLQGVKVFLSYANGKLMRAVTPGSGMIGEDITETVKMISNVPLHIPHKGSIEVCGMCTVPMEAYERINITLPEPYLRPEDYVSDSLKKRNTEEARKGQLAFIAIEAEELHENRVMQLLALELCGFTVVEHTWLWPETSAREFFAEVGYYRTHLYEYPHTGLDIEFDRIEQDVHATKGFQLNGRIYIAWKDISEFEVRASA